VTWHLRAETTVEAPPSVVWGVLVDVESYPEWNPVLRVWGDPVEGERLWALLLDRDLPPTPFRPTVTHFDPGHELRWRTEFPLGTVTAEHSFRVEPAPEGSRFVQSERFEGSLVDPVLRRLSDSVRRTFHRMNAAVAVRAPRLADSRDDG